MSEFAPSLTESMSVDVRELITALLKAELSFKKTGLDHKTSQGWTYAKLQDIYNAVQESLNDNHIRIVHYRRVVDGSLILFTRLIHAPTGQWIEDMDRIESEKPGNQEKGKANTYSKKQAVLTLCGISTEEFDDECDSEKQYLTREEVLSHPVTPEEIRELQQAFKSLPESIQASTYRGVLKFNKIDQLEELPRHKIDSVLRYINTKKG